MSDTKSIEANPEMVAADIKKYFAAAKKEKHGKPYRPGEKFKRPEFWAGAADLCIQCGADPYSFVRALFLYDAIPGGPYPNQLASQHAVRCYKHYRQLHGTDANSKQDVYAQEIKHMIQDCFLAAVQQKRKRLRDYLLDDSLGPDVIPAFVRILLLPHDRAVVERWRHAAYQELKPNQRLLDVLAELNYKLDFLLEMEP